MAVLTLTCGAALAPRLATAQVTPDSLGGQNRFPVQVGIGIGGGGPTGDRRCMAGAYLLPSLDVRTRGPVFIAIGAEWIQSFGPIETCLIVPGAQNAPDGSVLARGDDRFEIDGGGPHFTAGLGLELPFSLESRVEAGVARGQETFSSSWLPSLTAALGLTPWSNHMVISLEYRWFRVPYWAKRYSSEDEWFDEAYSGRPDGAATHGRWRGFRAVTVGFRF